MRLALASEGNSLLKMKLSDIVTVLDAYDALTGASYFNPDDLLTELYDILPESDYFKDRIVFIDAFRGFTAQEYKVIAEMMKKSTAVFRFLHGKRTEPTKERQKRLLLKPTVTVTLLDIRLLLKM